MQSYFAYMVPLREGGYQVTFPDFPEAATFGSDLDDALLMGQDMLDISVSERLRASRSLPEPSDKKAVIEAMKQEKGSEEPDSDCLIQLFMPDYVRRELASPIIVPRSVLEKIDAKARASGMQRSELVEAAAQAFESRAKS